jgi:uncharacterized protein
MANASVELRIQGISLEGDDPYVVLEDRTKFRRLLVPVGPFEASAILLEMECVATPRPMTHALLAELFQEGGFCLDGVELLDDRGEGARARLSYRKGLKKFEKEVRPSDALALALKLHAPVFADQAMLERQERSSGSWRRTKVLDMETWKERALRA